jgi:hypothetical protein
VKALVLRKGGVIVVIDRAAIWKWWIGLAIAGFVVALGACWLVSALQSSQSSGTLARDAGGR